MLPRIPPHRLPSPHRPGLVSAYSSNCKKHCLPDCKPTQKRTTTNPTPPWHALGRARSLAFGSNNLTVHARLYGTKVSVPNHSRTNPVRTHRDEGPSRKATHCPVLLSTNTYRNYICPVSRIIPPKKHRKAHFPIPSYYGNDTSFVRALPYHADVPKNLVP